MGIIVPALLVMARPAIAKPLITAMRRTGDLVAIRAVVNVREREGAKVRVAFSTVKAAMGAGHEHDLAAMAKDRRNPSLFGMTAAAIQAELRLMRVLVTRGALLYRAAELPVCVACHAGKRPVRAAQGKSCFVMIELDRRFEFLPGILRMAGIARHGLGFVRDLDKGSIGDVHRAQGIAAERGLRQKGGERPQQDEDKAGHTYGFHRISNAP